MMSVSRKQKILWWMLKVFAFSVPLSSFLSIRILVFASVFGLFASSSGHVLLRLARNAWDIMLYLLTLIIGLIYSHDLFTGLKVLETNFSFLAIPLILGCLPIMDHEKRNKIFSAFLSGLIASSLICLLFAVYGYTQEPNIQFFFFDQFTEVINSHPTYFAYYIIFAISVELYLLYYDEGNGYTLLKYVTIIFLFLILILTGGQTAFISLLFVFSFFILKFLIEEKNKKKGFVVGLVVLMLSCLFLITFVEKGNRVVAWNDSWERFVLWKSAISAIPNPLIGVGTGDYKIVLNEYYATHNLAHFATESYNAHNQLIQLLFSNGILGVLSFIIMVARPLYLAMKNRNILAILCVFPFLIYGMTEVFLGRYQGIVFFALLHQVFITEMISTNSRSISSS